MQFFNGWEEKRDVWHAYIYIYSKRTLVSLASLKRTAKIEISHSKT